MKYTLFFTLALTALAHKTIDSENPVLMPEDA
jgi:hypothetical protein